eukprot:1177439-Prorocentrum_minimum.AAC.1
MTSFVLTGSPVPVTASRVRTSPQIQINIRLLNNKQTNDYVGNNQQAVGNGRIIDVGELGGGRGRFVSVAAAPLQAWSILFFATPYTLRLDSGRRAKLEGQGQDEIIKRL